MKQLLAGIVLIIVLGVGGLVYRNVMERPAAGPIGQACTEEARTCPDGTSVMRVPPTCSFSPCAFPNVEVAGAGIAFAVPQGYRAGDGAYGADQNTLATFVKPSLSDSVAHTIMVQRYAIPDGTTGEEVILQSTRLQPADMAPEDMSRFSLTTVGGKSFYSIVIERFEAQVESAYYLVRDTDVLRFSVQERDVTDWMEPSLVVSELPEHQAFLSLLGTLQAIESGS